MKRIIVVLLLFIMIFCIVGCATEEPRAVCDSCGGVATTSIGGSSYILEEMGIDLSKCEKVTSFIYSADLCESCMEKLGPVVNEPVLPVY